MTATRKLKAAFFDFTGCEGCQLTVLDALQTDIQLLDVVEIVQFREAMSEKGEDYEVAFIEGSCTRTADASRLKGIRDQAEIVVTLGACAHLGGINAIRSRQSLAKVSRIVYGPSGKGTDSHKALPIAAIIPVDCVIPGCPIDRQEFVRALKALVQQRLPQLPDYAVCAECKLQENICLFSHGIPCLGPVTRAGCGAICPSFGAGCEGCRGLFSDPNLAWLRAAATEHGIAEERVDAAARLFLTYALMESNGDKHGQH
jgi:sulfhydrogenase subunit delta